MPAPECLPVEELADCARAALERDGRTILSYGPSPGYAPLREWLAERHGVDPVARLPHERLAAGLRLPRAAARARASACSSSGPTYDRPLKILRELGAEIVPLDCDDDGLDPDALEAALANGEPPAFLYLIPTFQNPSGRTLPEERRRRVVELAREHDLLVLEDDPVRPRPLRGRAAAVALRALRRRRSRTARRSRRRSRPGLRVGWFVLPEQLARELEATATATYITPVLLGQATVLRVPAARAASSRTSSGCAACSARAATRCSPRSTASCPTCAIDAPRRRLLPLGRARRRRRGRAARARRGGRRHVRQGHRLRRRARLAAARVQLRLARRDRRGRRPASGGAAGGGVAARAARRARARRRARAGSPRSPRSRVEPNDEARPSTRRVFRMMKSSA